MLPYLLAIALLLPTAQQDNEKRDNDKKRDPAEVTQSDAASLEAALAKGSTREEKVAAIRVHALKEDPEVVLLIAKALGDKQRGVQVAAIEALRFNPAPSGLDALEQALKKDKKIREDGYLHAALVRAVCQHGNKSSLEFLINDPLSKANPEVSRARILGLGMIRIKKSVAGLMGLMQRVPSRTLRPYMDDFRVALYVLTGIDHGTNSREWIRWWDANKRVVKVAAAPPKLPGLVQLEWNRYWELESAKKANGGNKGKKPEKKPNAR